MKPKPADVDSWHALRQFTDARIALGRAGVSLPTAPQLAFQLAHARARDAVHQPLDLPSICSDISKLEQRCVVLHSAAANRNIYLQRPDLGRRLDDASRNNLVTLQTGPREMAFDIAFVLADGLSPVAITRNAVPVLQLILPTMAAEGWSVAPIAVVEQGRVAIGDEIAALLGARMVVVFIGERPGLSAPDSMGLYLTWMPHVGLTDANRNCISNVRPAGLGHADAARTLLYLMTQSRKRELSGLPLKDETTPVHDLSNTRASSFLLGPP